jgi:hypothetical protein
VKDFLRFAFCAASLKRPDLFRLRAPTDTIAVMSRNVRLCSVNHRPGGKGYDMVSVIHWSADPLWQPNRMEVHEVESRCESA